MKRLNGARVWLTVATLLLPASMGAAAPPPPSVQESFRIGSGNGVICRAQTTLHDAAVRAMFDRVYAIVCKDASAPVGQLYALRSTVAEASARLDRLRDPGIICTDPKTLTLGSVSAVQQRRCQKHGEDLGYDIYTVAHGKTVFIAQGLDGYDSALRLGLETIALDKQVAGEVTAATTDVSNPGAFARVQAGSFDPSQAMAEAYRHNASGDYADSAEFFDALTERSNDPALHHLLGEYLANRALQRSNLGQFGQADALFAQLRSIPTTDPVQLRLRRNYLALHLLNEGKFDQADKELDRPMIGVAGPEVGTNTTPIIDLSTSSELNSDAGIGNAAIDSAELTPAERAGILDAQSIQLHGTIARLKGQNVEANDRFQAALAQLARIRGGRVATTARLRSQILSEQAALALANGDKVLAERLLRQALLVIDTEYPGTSAALAARARLAGFLANTGQSQAALSLFKSVVDDTIKSDASTTGFQSLLEPYFALLAAQIPDHPALTSDLFQVSQTLIRPGVADTQAVLARALSGGSDDASRLFRQSVALTRDIERTRVEIGRLEAIPQQTPEVTTQLGTAHGSLTKLQGDQVGTQASLARFPRYRAVESSILPLSDLEASLRPGEAYLKITVVGSRAYGLFATHDRAMGYLLAADTLTIARKVNAIRDSIARDIGGNIETDPFDVDDARSLYVDLLGPAAPSMTQITHLIFEPDGPMLKLPINLLITDDASLAAYKAQSAKIGADPYDYRGMGWLGRSTNISTAVSARSFRDLRATPASSAKFGYLGLGENAPIDGIAAQARTRSVSNIGAIDCNWPSAVWSNPINPSELSAARKAVGGTGDDVITGSAFSDTAVINRTDLADFRIIHFATHGLVTAPRPECPARPALLTSFGGKLPDGRVSDGLLSFREVFDLKLNADLVILSACDTAGEASVDATREAGETSGGGSALDGLVRAFVGAGGRAVLASHWPVPEEYHATERLVTQFFAVPRGTSIGEALRRSETQLMDDKDTSHPYYWSAFALVGDSAQPLLRPL